MSATGLTVEQIRENLAGVGEQLHEFGVQELLVFGSVARGQASANSDIDFLVRFCGPITSDQYFGLLFLLEDLFHAKVDLAEPECIHPTIRESVLTEARRVA